MISPSKTINPPATSREGKTSTWAYTRPWLDKSGNVWVHVGYGDWELLAPTEARAQIQLEALQRAGFRDVRQHTLITWLMEQGQLERKVIEVTDSPKVQPQSPAIKNLNVIEKLNGVSLSIRDFVLTIQDFIGQRVALLGISGSGKTNTAAALIEELIPYLPMTIIDIEGEYWTLKTKYKVLVVGRSPNCDIDVPTIHAEALAEYAYANNVNVVLDFKYHDNEEEMFEFCLLYFERIWKLATRNQKPYEIVIEESHEFIPQSSNTPISKLFKRIATRGRKHGLGVILASQRSTLVDKNVLTQAGIYFLHRVVHPKDMQVYKEFIPLKPAEVETLVGNLQPGECVFMRDHKPQTAKIRRRYTAHAGSTPTLGEAPTEQLSLNQVDEELLGNLRLMFNAPPKDDFTALRTRIADLERLNEHLQEENARLTKENEQLRQERKEYVAQDVPQDAPRIIPVEEAKPEAPSIIEIAAEKVVTAEEKAYERRLATQKAAFRKVLDKVLGLPNWQRFALAYMTETNKPWDKEALAAAIGISPAAIKSAPFTEMRGMGLIERSGERGDFIYKSNLDQMLHENYPELEADKLKQLLFKTVKELA